MKISINAVLAHGIIFTINLEIGSCFICFLVVLKKRCYLCQVWYPHSNIIIFNEIINGKSQTNRDQKTNLLFLQWHDQSEKVWIKLVKNW